MASVFETIFDSITDQNTSFVFPSEVTAMLWARKFCLYSNTRSVALDRFLAWDKFKEVSIQETEKNKSPASSLVRRLFAFSLVRQNAAEPFLTALVPAEYAASGEVFADSIAMILSSLRRWEELHDTGRSGKKDDDEDRDLRIIKTMYAAFLDKHNLFEPAWEKIPFSNNKNRYIIFFPEVLADFSEYAELLDIPVVRLFSVQNFSCEKSTAECPAENPGLLFFDSARQEIRSAVLELRRLYESGIPYEDMAITLPDYKKTAPYIERELSLHDIPFSSRAGKSLSEYPIGRLFSLIGSCTSTLFSFDALKPLLLDHAIPWKHPQKNSALIKYGIANHCVAPFMDRKRLTDAWEESFKRNPSEELSDYYRELKRSLAALSSASSFKEIRERYFAFRSFLDIDKCGKESDAVLARCIEELSVLIEAEADYSGLCPANPYDFFVSHLSEINYVYAQEGGVNIYDYPVAAGAPFGCHLLLNVSQAAATVQYKPLAFLRQDKRAQLGLEDSDVSEPALALYNIAPWKNYVCHTRISASEKTFAGWAIPHSIFAANTVRQESAAVNSQAHFTNEHFSNDYFITERHWRAGNAAKPAQLYPVQYEGFEQWSSILLHESDLESAAAETAFGKKSCLQDIAGTKTSVSATDLNEFFTCPVLWLYRRIFRLEPYLEDAALLDDNEQGLIYHEILCRLFARIKEEDKKFNKDNLDKYFSYIEEITAAVLRSDDTLRGPLVYPLLAPLAESINKRLRQFLKTEALYFDGYEVKELEQKYDVIQENIRLTGWIDRVSLSPQGPMIIDYKTNAAPSKPQCRKEEDKEGIGLENFQIPMYIKLYEDSGASAGTKVDKAFFASIRRNEIVPIMGELQGKRGLISREEYQPTMDALEEAIRIFSRAVSVQDFSYKTIPYKTCPSCEYKTICRSVYSLNRPKRDKQGSA